MSEAAIGFLQEHGIRSLISLGCGKLLNRLDNHIKLMVKCGLEYYVAIDRVPLIEYNPSSAFQDLKTANLLLSSHYGENAEEFSRRVMIFPGTYVEELANIPCKVLVCQRVLPFRHWENIIKSMGPLLILQEDLIGCELQDMDRELYRKSFPGIIHYQLLPFRPSRLIPGERNIILWRRKDFFPCQEDMKPWWEKLFFRFSRHKSTTPTDCGQITPIS